MLNKLSFNLMQELNESETKKYKINKKVIVESDNIKTKDLQEDDIEPRYVPYKYEPNELEEDNLPYTVYDMKLDDFYYDNFGINPVFGTKEEAQKYCDKLNSELNEECKDKLNEDDTEQKEFDSQDFEKKIPKSMRWKSYDELDNGLYWVTQEFFTNSDLEKFKEALKNTKFTIAYIIPRDFSHSYDYEEDKNTGYITTIDLNKNSIDIPQKLKDEYKDYEFDINFTDEERENNNKERMIKLKKQFNMSNESVDESSIEEVKQDSEDKGLYTESINVKNLKTVKSQGNVYMLESAGQYIIGENYNESEKLIENAEIYENKEEADKDYLNRCGVNKIDESEEVKEEIRKKLDSELEKIEKENPTMHITSARKQAIKNLGLEEINPYTKHGYKEPKNALAWGSKAGNDSLHYINLYNINKVDEGLIDDIKLGYKAKKANKATQEFENEPTEKNKEKSNKADADLDLERKKQINKLNSKIDKIKRTY